jgi:hypothetical protein
MPCRIVFFALANRGQLARRRAFEAANARQLRLAIRCLNGSGSGSEEEEMSRIVLSTKAAKLMKLCDVEGFDSIEDLLRASTTGRVCPAICMTEGCDYTTEMKPNQQDGYCEACGGNTVVSALVLAGLSN